MRKPASFVFGICLFAAVLSARAQQQKPHYVYDEKILQVVDVNLAAAKYRQWQVWLYEEGARIPRYAVGMQYSRWGLIEGTSAENVMQQLHSSQSFEAAYLRFFGPDTWNRYTFFNPVGPIAVSDPLFEDQPPALEKLYQLRWLQDRVNKLIRAATPSLENNQRLGAPSPVEGYFDRSETPYSGSPNFTASCLTLAPKFGSSRSESFRQKHRWHSRKPTCRKLPKSCRV